MDTYVPGYLKANNRKVAFNLFQRYGELSRSEVVSLSNMSFPTASKSIDYLLSKGIIVETDKIDESMKGPGKKRKTLCFNPTVYKAVCLNFEGLFVEIGLMDLSGAVYSKGRLPFSDFENIEQQKKLAGYISSMVKSQDSKILGMGIALPTTVNPDTGDVLGYYSLGLKKGGLFSDLFSGFLEGLSLPYFIENDVNMAALGEFHIRHKKENNNNICYLSLGTGLGSGIIIDGRLWRGTHFHAGEIGNMLVSDVQKVVSLESIINIEAINERFHTDLLKGEGVSEEVREDISSYIVPNLALGIYNVVMVLDMTTFVLGGIITEILGSRFLNKLEDEINRMLIPRHISIKICQSSQASITLVGCSNLVFDNLLFGEFQKD